MLALIYLLVLCLCLGYSLTFFWKDGPDMFESLVMRLGIGLAAIPLLGVVLNLFHIPLHWAVLLFLALIVPVSLILKKKMFFEPLKMRLHYLFLLLLFALVFFTMYQGSSSYPWFEDTDPYSHTAAASIISSQLTFSKPADMYVTHYSEPYPQGFPLLMGILHQLDPSVVHVLKFFNSLLIALSVVFFYFFVRKLVKSRTAAMLSAFVIAILPSFQSHFVFAQTYAVTLIIPSLYAALHIAHDRRWVFPSAVVFSGVLLTQQLTSVALAAFLGSMVLVYIYEWLIQKTRDYNAALYLSLAGILSVVLSFGFFFIPMLVKFGPESLSTQYTLGTDPLHKSFFNFADSYAVRSLTLADFVHPCMESALFGGCPEGYPNKTDNPTGFGFVVFIMLLIGIAYLLLSLAKLSSSAGPSSSHTNPEGHTSASSHHLNSNSGDTGSPGDAKGMAFLLLIIWLAICFIGVMGDRLPLKILPNRWWAFLSIPVAIIAAYGVIFSMSLGKKAKIPAVAVLLVLLVSLFFTSFIPKLEINSSVWMPHVFTGDTEIAAYLQQGKLDGYLWLLTLPKGTPVFDFCSGDDLVFASDAVSFPLDPSVPLHRYKVLDTSHHWDARVLSNVTSVGDSPMMSEDPADLNAWLKAKGFLYITLSSRCAEKFGDNATVSRLSELAASGKFSVAHQSVGFFALRVV